MKIAVSAQSNHIASAVDPRFGRAACFIIFDLTTGEHEVVDNTQNLNALQGAGVQSAENVARQDVAAVLTGNCGPKAFRTLAAAGIKVFTGIQGTVQEALEQYSNGTLQENDKPNVQGHWS